MIDRDSNGPQRPAAGSVTGAVQPPSYLFTLRLWHAEAEEGRREWRGRLHHVGHDDISYFRGWAALLPVLLSMLRRAGVTISVEQDEVAE